MDFDETWQVGLRPGETKPCTFPAKSHYGFRIQREKMGRRGVVFLSRERRTTSANFLGSISAKLSTNTCPGGVSRHMVSSYSRKVSIKGSNFQKKTVFLPWLCSLYGSREMFCDAYTLSIPQWTSHRCILPGWLLLRDVPFSSYPPPKVILCHSISNGDTWMGTHSRHLARGRTLINRPVIFSNITRHDRIADMHRYTNPVHIF